MFDYWQDGLLYRIRDPQLRYHELTHTDQTDGRRRLTGVRVLGPGSPNRTVYQWSFQYDTTNPDHLVRKVEPSGKQVSYVWETVSSPRTRNLDYEARLLRCSYTDDLNTPSTYHQTDRAGTTLTFPGGDSYRYDYSGHHLAAITHLNTGASLHWTWDLYHNLATFRTGLDAGNLVSLAYTYTDPDARHIGAVTATDILGNRASGVFDDWNLPTEFRQHGLPGHGDQVTRLIYDSGGTKTVGNLTSLTLASGSGVEDTTSLQYQDSLRPGLPTAITSSTGFAGSLEYHRDGSVLRSRSPQNLLGELWEEDRGSSDTAMFQNIDELPSSVSDPKAHQVSIAYNAESAGSSRLVVTTTNQDGSTRRVTLDARGLPVKSVDENGVCTLTDYNRTGQPVRVVRAAGTAYERVTRSAYDHRKDLISFDPPSGASGRVIYEYCRYLLGSPGQLPVKASPEVYEGQVTRIRYPDGTSEWFGFNGDEEPEWQCGADGGVTRFYRDSLHRATRVEYPGTPGYPAFSVETAHDEFGRVTQMSDPTGTTTWAYDALNRVTSFAPAVGFGATYSYVRDTTNNRWKTFVVTGGSGTLEFRGDPKGRTREIVNASGQVTTRFFDLDGKPILERRPNAIETEYAWTNRDWIAAIQHRVTGGPVIDTFNYSYLDAVGAYDPTGHLQAETDAGGRVHRFQYDPLYQLVMESHPDFGTSNYTLDLNGNRTLKSGTGGSNWAGYDSQNKLLWTNTAANAPPVQTQTEPYRIYSYDLRGNVTDVDHRESGSGGIFGIVHDSYEWDGMGKLRRVKCVGANQERYSAQYDGAGTRVSAQINGTNHTYSYGAGLLRDQMDNGFAVRYTPGVSQNRGGSEEYFHTDWIGSTRYLTSAGGATNAAFRYDAFGNTTQQSGFVTTTHGFAGAHGYQNDVAARLHLLGARYYDPAVGRFTSADPIGHAGGLNLYGYVGGDPVNQVDPSGLNPALPVVVTYAGVTGAGRASDRYVADHPDDYTWHGHVWANTKGAVGGILDLINPVTIARELHGSAANLGTVTGLHDAGCASGLDVALAAGDTGFRIVTTAVAIQGVGRSAVGAAGGLRSAIAARGGARALSAGVVSGGRCFPAGTPIRTDEGDKPIEEIGPGDVVLSADPDTGKQSYQKVVRTFVREADELFAIRTDDGRTIETTGEHPFWVEGKGFVAAKRLARSNLLRDASGCPVAVAEVTSRPVKVRVYNFEVEKTHTYFAGGWWVHNACPVDDLIEQAKRQYPKKANRPDEEHHIIPKYLGGDPKGPTRRINAAYHQYITNEFRHQHKYGQEKPGAARREEILKDVYDKYPLP